MTEKRILVVEDDFDNTTLVRVLLEREHFEVIAAPDGEIGLDVARSTHPDLIVLDLDMPKLDGWNVLKQLKGDQKTKHIPIVVVTAHLMSDERQKVYNAGGKAYIQKPFAIRELVEEIHRWV